MFFFNQFGVFHNKSGVEINRKKNLDGWSV